MIWITKAHSPQRVGTEVVGLSGRGAILAHILIRSPLEVGRYGVEPGRLLPLIEEELVRPPGRWSATARSSWQR